MTGDEVSDLLQTQGVFSKALEGIEVVEAAEPAAEPELESAEPTTSEPTEFDAARDALGIPAAEPDEQIGEAHE